LPLSVLFVLTFAVVWLAVEVGQRLGNAASSPHVWAVLIGLTFEHRRAV
jgi:hypothetical protein